MQKFSWIALMLVALATISSANIDGHDELIEDQIINYRTDSRARRQVASKDEDATSVDDDAPATPSLEIKAEVSDEDLGIQLPDIIPPVTILPTLPTVPVTLPTVPITLPTLPPINTTIFNPNCSFIGLEISVVLNILDPLVCGKVLCVDNPQCTHFTHDPTKDGGTCVLHKSTDTSAPTLKGSTSTCGHIPNRSCHGNALLTLCLDLGLNINLGALQALLPLLG